MMNAAGWEFAVTLVVLKCLQPRPDGAQVTHTTPQPPTFSAADDAARLSFPFLPLFRRASLGSRCGTDALTWRRGVSGGIAPPSDARKPTRGDIF